MNEDVDRAVFAYNRSDAYVDQVTRMAAEYREALGTGAAIQATGDRQAIIERAYTWLNARTETCRSRSPTEIDHESQNCGVPYSMELRFDPPEGRDPLPDEVTGYRQDCSGYVSMAWGLGRPGETTVTLKSSHTVSIGKDELQPGDILLDPDPGGSGHVVLFERWANDERTSYWGLEQSGGADETVRRVIPYPYFGGSGEYTPHRWRQLA